MRKRKQYETARKRNRTERKTIGRPGGFVVRYCTRLIKRRENTHGADVRTPVRAAAASPPPFENLKRSRLSPPTVIRLDFAPATAVIPIRLSSPRARISEIGTYRYRRVPVRVDMDNTYPLLFACAFGVFVSPDIFVRSSK